MVTGATTSSARVTRRGAERVRTCLALCLATSTFVAAAVAAPPDAPSPAPNGTQLLPASGGRPGSLLDPSAAGRYPGAMGQLGRMRNQVQTAPQPVPLPGVVPPPGFDRGESPQPVPPRVPGAAPFDGNEPQPLPRPNPLPFGDAGRLNRLGQPGQLGATPVPTEKDLADFRQFVEGVVDPRNTLDLVEGRARLITLKAVPVRTQIADPSYVALRLLEPKATQMTIIGLRTGVTVLNLWFTDPDNKDKEKVLSYLVRVFPDPELKVRQEAVYRALEIEINKAFPNSRVRLALVGEKLMVSGQAHDVYEATQIIRIAGANAPGGRGGCGGGGGGLAPTNWQQGGQFGAGGLGQNRGTVPPTTSQEPTGAAGDPLRPELTPGQESYQPHGGPLVINNLRIPGEQQIMLRVMVAEVNRAAARTLGVDFSFQNSAGATVFAQRTVETLGAAAGGVGGGGLGGGGGPGAGGAGGFANLPVNLDGGQIRLAILALRTLNYARSLAEPNLTAMNGQTATFLAGGQFPVPVLGGLGNTGFGGSGGLQGVQFVPFGVQLEFLPTLTDRDRVRLSLQATVSTRDGATGTNINGANVPGLNARTFSTTVELREGQTMAVAGLIQNNLGADAARVPGLGDLPYVGRLFGLQRTSAGEQELIILVTPQLVHPMECEELTPLPGSDIFEPGDVEFYLAGRLESRRSYDYRSPVRTDIQRMLAYRRCEEQYIFGPTGHTQGRPLASAPVGGR